MSKNEHLFLFSMCRLSISIFYVKDIENTIITFILSALASMEMLFFLDAYLYRMCSKMHATFAVNKQYRNMFCIIIITGVVIIRVKLIN